MKSTRCLALTLSLAALLLPSVTLAVVAHPQVNPHLSHPHPATGAAVSSLRPWHGHGAWAAPVWKVAAPPKPLPRVIPLHAAHRQPPHHG